MIQVPVEEIEDRGHDKTDDRRTGKGPDDMGIADCRRRCQVNGILDSRHEAVDG
jgi:hypothetical protein